MERHHLWRRLLSHLLSYSNNAGPTHTLTLHLSDIIVFVVEMYVTFSATHQDDYSPSGQTVRSDRARSSRL